MTYTYDQTVKIMESIVEKMGEDYIYPQGALGFGVEGMPCIYRNTETGAPACIVGHVLARVNLLDQVVEGTAASALGVVKEYFDYDAVYLLDIAQSTQDSGSPWGEAFRIAKERAESRGPE